MPKQKFNLKKRLIRKYFLGQEKESKKKEVPSTELLEIGMEYIQMRLPVEKITREFEDNIEYATDLYNNTEATILLYKQPWNEGKVDFDDRMVSVSSWNDIIAYIIKEKGFFNV